MLAVSLYQIGTVSCAETEARRPRCRFVLNRNSLVDMSLAETKARRPRRKFVLNRNSLACKSLAETKSRTPLISVPSSVAEAEPEAGCACSLPQVYNRNSLLCKSLAH